MLAILAEYMSTTAPLDRHTLDISMKNRSVAYQLYLFVYAYNYFTQHRSEIRM